MPHYDEARLVRLLRLLRAPPVEWVRRAQRIPLGSASLTDRDLAELARRLEGDPAFRSQFDADPVGAVRSAGMQELGARLQYEIGELVALAERVAGDAGRRQEIMETLGAKRTPVADAESFLQLVSVPRESADFVAHARDQGQLEQRALLLLLTSAAVADEIRAALSRV